MDKLAAQLKYHKLIVRIILVAGLLLIVSIIFFLFDRSGEFNRGGSIIGTSLALGLRLIILYGFYTAIRSNKKGRSADRGMTVALSIFLLILGLFLIDGAVAFTNDLVIVSVLFFAVTFCDIIAAVTAIVVSIRFRIKKT